MTDGVLDVCLDTFGTDMDGMFTYMPKKGTSYKVRGIFDNEYQEADPNIEAGVTSVIPVLGVKLAELKEYPIKDDKALVKGVLYRIIDVRKDTNGGAKLYLHKLP